MFQESREKQLAVEAAQRAEVREKLRSMERNIKAMKDNTLRLLRRRRDEARLRVELVCEREELSKALSGDTHGDSNGNSNGSSNGDSNGESKGDAASAMGSSGSLQTSSVALLMTTLPSSLEAATNPTVLDDGIATSRSSSAATSDRNASAGVTSAVAPASETVVAAVGLADRAPCPPAETGPIRMDPGIFGQLLELWGFLNTFSGALKLTAAPSLEKLSNAIRVLDPSYKALSPHIRNTLRSFYFVSNGIEEQAPEDAVALLSHVGMKLVEPLLKEFNRLMGLDVAEPMLGTCRIPVNALTWREIARYCCRWNSILL